MTIKYDTIGVNYNQTRKADPYLCDQLFQNLRPKPNGLYLDIGCGTGNYTHELQKRGVAFIGIDPSNEMLDKARVKNEYIDWREGSAENTRLQDQTIDGIVGSLTIHHWTDLEMGFKEMYRVLKPGGRMVIFTSTPKQMEGYWLNYYFPKMLADSIEQMPSFELVEKSISNAGFSTIKTDSYSIHPELEDLFLYCGKQQPEMYFDAAVRHGISSFSSLANKQEVEKGLATLEQDIQSGKVQQVMTEYENDLGDYLYFIGIK